MSLFGDIFGSSGGDYKNPADAAMPYLNQIPGTIKPYYDPYITSGRQSLSSLMGQYGNLINNPGSVMSNLSGGFKESPGYQFNMNQGINAVNNAAAAGGMLGTPYHQMQAGQMASNIANQDYYNYLNHVLGLYGTGLSGLGDINKMGYGASNELASALSSNLMNQSGLAFQGQENLNQMNNDRASALSGGIGSAIGLIGKFL